MTLPSLSLASILVNALHSHGHQQVLRGGKLSIPTLPSTKKLVGTNWQLKDIGGVPVVHPPIPESQELFFLTETELSGYDGCNWFYGVWDSVPVGAKKDDGSSQSSARPRISIDIKSTTYKGCFLTSEAGEQQSNFMIALRQEAIGFSLSADEQELTLYHTLDGSQDVPIVLSRIPNPIQPDEKLIGTSWIATDIVYPDSGNELRPVLEDHPVTLEFLEGPIFNAETSSSYKSSVRGNTGTNEFFGYVSEMTEWEFTVTNVWRTTAGWEEDNDPKRLQEFAWMGILEMKTFPYTLFEERIGDTNEWTQVLVLGPFQAPLARFIPGELNSWGEPIDSWRLDYQDDETTQLAGSKWIATNIPGDDISKSPESQFQSNISIFFESETIIKGHGGCNEFEASWYMLFGSHFLSQFRVKDLFSSRKYCNGKVGEKENDFFRGLKQDAITFDIVGSELTLWDTITGDDGLQSRGNLIGSFTNAPVPNWGGQSLVGMTGEEAKAAIQAINPSLKVYIVPEGAVVTTDWRMDRVRISVDKEGKVKREPQRG